MGPAAEQRARRGAKGMVRSESGSSELLALNWAPPGGRSEGRPQTATLERPRVLDTSYKRLDMTLTRKALLSITNLCKRRPRGAREHHAEGISRVKPVGRRPSPRNVPEPCRSCGRPDLPERLHSHPPAREVKPSHPAKPVKSSVQRPVPIKFRSTTAGDKRPSTLTKTPSKSSPSHTSKSSPKTPASPRSSVSSPRSFVVVADKQPRVPAVVTPRSTGLTPRAPPAVTPRAPPVANVANTRASPVVTPRAPPAVNVVTQRAPLVTNVVNTRASPVVNVVTPRAPAVVTTRVPPAANVVTPRAPPVANVMTPRAPAVVTTQAPPVTTPQAPLASSTPRTPRGPRLLVCYLCGREFGTASLPLHEPRCREKWERLNARLPGSMQRVAPEKPPQALQADDWNEFAWRSSQAQLVPCEGCGRTFLPDRLPVHRRGCKAASNAANSSAPPVIRAGSAPRVPAAVCYICGRNFGSRSIHIHEPQCLQRWRADNERLPAEQRRVEPQRGGPAVPPPPPPAPSPRPKAALVTCYLCGRNFGSLSLPIHEPQCLRKWNLDNDKLPPDKRRAEPSRPEVRFTADGSPDPEATFHAIWQSHLEQLVPCRACGRTFFPDRLEVHERSCREPTPRR